MRARDTEAVFGNCLNLVSSLAAYLLIQISVNCQVDNEGHGVLHLGGYVRRSGTRSGPNGPAAAI